MKRFFFCCCLVTMIVSCNEKIYPPIKQSSLNDILNDSLLLIAPFYSYKELVEHMPHDEKYWVFGKDTSRFFETFSNELKKNHKLRKVLFLDQNLLSRKEADSCFGLLSRNSIDSFELYVRDEIGLLSSKQNVGILKVDFMLNKMLGTSGLGPVGDFSPFGDYCIYLFVSNSNNLVYYNSMRRHASFFNRLYNKKRSRNVIKAFFR